MIYGLKEEKISTTIDHCLSAWTFIAIAGGGVGGGEGELLTCGD